MEIERLVFGACRERWIFQREQSLARIKGILQENSRLQTEEIFDALVTRLSHPSLQTRYLAMEAIDVFFTKSKIFREVCCERIGEIVQFCVSDPSQDWTIQGVRELRDFALDVILKWKKRFGKFYFVLEMTCDYIEHSLHVPLTPESRRLENGGGISPEVAEERERNRRRYCPVLLRSENIIKNAQEMSSEAMEALSIVECDSNWIEWEEVACPSSEHSTDVESEALDENTGLGTYKAPLIIPQKSLLSSPRTDHSIEVDPVMVEVLSSTLAMIERRLNCELQELITACLHLRDDDISGSRSSILQRAVHVRNQLQEIKNRISKLGIEIKGRSQAPRYPSEPLIGPSQIRNSKRKRGVDPTQAKLETPYVLAASLDEILSRSKETQSTQILNSETPSVEIRKQLSPEVAQSLLRQAPRLDEVQTRTQLQKDRWRFDRRSNIESPCQRVHDLETPCQKVHDLETPCQKVHDLETPCKKVSDLETPCQKVHDLETPCEKRHDLETPLPERPMSVREADRLYNERIISGAGSTEGVPENNAHFETRAHRRKKRNPKIAKIKRLLFEK